MAYERSVSAPEHERSPETVWHVQMPQIRFGRDAIEELAHQLAELGVAEGASGLLVTDETLVNWATSAG